MKNEIKERLEYLREQIEAENISCEEIAELQSLAEYIDAGDVQLLEWAGVPEKKCSVCVMGSESEPESDDCIF